MRRIIIIILAAAVASITAMAAPASAEDIGLGNCVGVRNVNVLPPSVGHAYFGGLDECV